MMLSDKTGDRPLTEEDIRFFVRLYASKLTRVQLDHCAEQWEAYVSAKAEEEQQRVRRRTRHRY